MVEDFLGESVKKVIIRPRRFGSSPLKYLFTIFFVFEDENEVCSDSSDDFDDEANAGWNKKVLSTSFFGS